MHILVVCLIYFLGTLAGASSLGNLPAPVDSRNLSDIYAAAQQESGVLQVVYGGDGMYYSSSVSKCT